MSSARYADASHNTERAGPQTRSPRDSVANPGDLACSGQVSGSQAHSAFPLRLPFSTGHRLVREVQEILERACFKYSEESIPGICASRGWTCAEQVELNLWVHNARKYTALLPDALSSALASANANAQGSSLYRSLVDIRHTAVHRLPVSINGIKTFLEHGELLATLLGNGLALSELSTLKAALETVTKGMEDHKNMLGAKLNITMGRIATERIRLNMEEEEAMASMMREDAEYQIDAGASFERTLVDVMEARRLPVTGNGFFREAEAKDDQEHQYGLEEDSWEDVGNDQELKCGPTIGDSDDGSQKLNVLVALVRGINNFWW